MDKLRDRELEQIESRLDAFAEWFERVNADRTGYDSEAALEDWRLVAEDLRRLIEQVRATRMWNQCAVIERITYAAEERQE